MFKSAKQQVQTAESSVPLERIIAAMSEAIKLGKVCLIPKTKQDEWFGVQGSEPIGYVYGDHALLSEWATFGWYSEACRKRGELVGFAWDQVAKAAKVYYPNDLTGRTLYLPDQEKRARMTAIPLSLLADSAVEPAVESGVTRDA